MSRGTVTDPHTGSVTLPELPEVEMTRRHLDHAMQGRRMVEVETTHPRTARHNDGPRQLDERLRDRRVLSVDRIGKFLTAPLDDGQTMVAHLGMSGRFWVGEPDQPEPMHTHFRTLLDDGSQVRFIDPRTFGFVAVVVEDEMAGSGIARLGPDAWLSAPTPAALRQALARRVAPIKALLLDQVILSGLGNIYADEALHRAGIHPLRPGSSLDADEVTRLLQTVRAVLAEALEHGGTSLDDLAFLLPDGRAGENLDRLRVYGRTDLPCPVCGTPIQRVIIRARSSHFCPSCQSESG
ncbi:MAG: bifunctional DNA-formamidopyrimidine glycosylase/DNA-(apurinic or apyrimidinic site) lyase [Acidimicrobiia bacterium]